MTKEEILELADNSVTNANLIREIALMGLSLPKEEAEQMYKKIKKEFESAGLYPHIIKKTNII
jgi:hypothetical protein